MCEEIKARAAAAGLWVLVALGAAGGVTALLGSGPHPIERPRPSGVVPGEAVAAAGFGERFVAAYLAGDTELTAFLGYTPDLPLAPMPARPVPGVRAVRVEPIGDRYWAVTVAADDDTGEAFWRVAVAEGGGGGRLVATGLPAPVAAPPTGDAPDLAVALSDVPPAGDPAVETVTGWVAAYACGQGDAARYLAPGVDLAPVTPPACTEARLDRWGSSEPDGTARLTVVTEAVLADDEGERRVAFALVLARRGGRWEIAELLGGPPLTTDAASDPGDERGVVG